MTELGSEIIQGLTEALADAQGNPAEGTITHQVDLGAVDVKAIRKRLGLTQEKMALALGTSVSGIRKWEQGQRQPRGAARTLLLVMDKEPEAVARALGA